MRPVRPNKRPQFRPDLPCETQDAPDLNAAGGPPDQTVLANGTEVVGGIIPGLPKSAQGKLTPEQEMASGWVKEYAKARAEGRNLPDPTQASIEGYKKLLKSMGLATTPQGKIYKRGDDEARDKAIAEGGGSVR